MSTQRALTAKTWDSQRASEATSGSCSRGYSTDMNEVDGLEQDVWERKYHLALERMERDERDFRTLEEGLRRLVLRLTALARGQSAQADRLLDQLGDGVSLASDPDTLDTLLGALAEAVTALEPRPAQTPHAVIGAPESVLPAAAVDTAPEATEALRQVLYHVVLMPALAGRVDALHAALGQARDAAAFSSVARSLADLVNLQRDSLRHDIARLQDLLADVSGRLGDMTRYLESETEHVATGDEQGRDLDATVREEMRLLVEQTQSATHLDALQAQVNARLSMIGEHFRAFRMREDERLATYRDRAERMKDRVEELETQATSLQDSLRREHELALTDPLTGLPNRLSYERRMAEIEQDVREHGGIACVAAFDS